MVTVLIVMMISQTASVTSQIFWALSLNNNMYYSYTLTVINLEKSANVAKLRPRMAFL